MRRTPQSMTLGATAGGVLLVTSAAVTILIYVVLTVVDLLPSSFLTENLVRLAN